ncbi:hypothetical protein B296_00058264, partial [Ensete ventricosum]
WQVAVTLLCGSGRQPQILDEVEEEEAAVARMAGARALAAIEEKERGWPTTEQEAAGGRGEDVAGSEGRRQRPWSMGAAAAIFLKKETIGSGCHGGWQRLGVEDWCSRGAATRLGAGSERRKGWPAMVVGRRGIEVAGGGRGG